MKKLLVKGTLLLVVAVLFATVNATAQTVIYSQNFDSSTTVLPTGWTTFPVNGWIMDSTNSSFGYTNSSGLNNVVIKNASPSNTYYLLTNPISTINFDSISVLWAARLTTHFPDSGSTVQSFDYSIDNGTTWSGLFYYENFNNSAWIIENGEVRIPLPPDAANQPSLIFRWVVNIVNAPSGTYRIDDFDVQGNLTAGINKIENGSFVVSIDNNQNLQVKLTSPASSFVNTSIELIDLSGRICFQRNLTAAAEKFNIENLQKGIYVVKIANKEGVFSKKVIKLD